MIVGLHGTIGAGKDTLADIMVKELGFQKVAYADPLRNFLMAQNPWIRHDRYEAWSRLRPVIEKYGWQGYKQSPFANEIRALIQRTGTEAGRWQVDENVWINSTLMNLPKGDVVITDIRFHNELEILRAGHAKFIKIVRPSAVSTSSAHSSEEGLPDEMFDLVIDNSGTIPDLERVVFSKVVPLITKV